MEHSGLIHAGFVLPIIELLQERGAPARRYSEQTGLGCFDLSNRNLYLPVAAYIELLDLVARREFGSQIPEELMQRYTVANMGDWGEFISASPTVLAACNNACLPEARTFSHETMALQVSGCRARLCDRVEMPPGLVSDWTTKLAAELMLSGFRMYTARHWVAPVVILPKRLVEDDIVSRFGKAVAFSEDDTYGFEFPASLLAHEAIDARNGASSSETHFPIGLEASIGAVLDAWDPPKPATLTAVAQALGLAPRSMQRSLEYEGKTYSEILDRWRMAKACKLLGGSEMSIAEISERVHYAHSPSFVRAFKRFTGVAPEAFRQSLD